MRVSNYRRQINHVLAIDFDVPNAVGHPDDVRFCSDWYYQPKFVLGFGVLLLAGHLLLVLSRRRPPEPEEEAPPVTKKAGLWSRYSKIGALTEPKIGREVQRYESLWLTSLLLGWRRKRVRRQVIGEVKTVQQVVVGGGVARGQMR